MKKLLLCTSILILAGCSNEDATRPEGQLPGGNYKQAMRDLVIAISQSGKAVNPNFLIIPQNGAELISATGDETTTSANADYLNAIDGNGQEDLFYGYDLDDAATLDATTQYLQHFLDISKSNGKTILVTDYCATTSKISDSYAKNEAAGYVSFAAPDRSLNVIPSSPLHNENSAVITALSQVRNFAFYINPENAASKQDFISGVAATNYDAVIIDLFFEGSTFTQAEVEQLKHKANGGKRLVICYMSIGEAEDYRYYWQASWNLNRPQWLEAENPDWPGNFKVHYWNPDWQHIIYGSPDSYLDKITSAGFDGVYLDIIDAFEYFEN